MKQADSFQSLGPCSRNVVRSGRGIVEVRGDSQVFSVLSDSSHFAYRIPEQMQDYDYDHYAVSHLELIQGKDAFGFCHAHGAISVRYSDERFSRLPSDTKRVGTDLVWILLPILEFSRQSVGQYLVHASSICFGDRGAVFFGGSHAGKTSVSTCLWRNYGASIMGTEYTLLGESGIEGGTKTIEVDASVWPEFRSRYGLKETKGCSRIALDARKAGPARDSAQLELMCLVSHSNEPTLTIFEWNRRKSFVNLGEWLRWMITCPQSYLYNGRQQMVSFDTPELSERRLSLIEDWLNSGRRIVFLKGNPDAIARHVAQELS